MVIMIKEVGIGGFLVNEFKDFLESSDRSNLITGERLGPGSIKDINLRKALSIRETVYTVEEVVSPKRDVIVPFYLPGTTINLEYVYLNLYFPGLQPGDYPFNSSTLYLSALTKGTMTYLNGAFGRIRDEYSIYSGNGASGGNYIWYRGYTRFHIAPIHGFKITSSDLSWSLANTSTVGAGANTQHDNELHAIDDYEILDQNDWSLATQVDYGDVNAYTDTVGNVYTQDVKTRIQALIVAGTDYACFRFLGEEHTDAANANNYHISDPQIKFVLEEDTDEPTSVYVHNGKTFGSNLQSFTEDIEDFDLSNYFSGVGKKQIKFSCAQTRRINVLLRIGYRSR